MMSASRRSGIMIAALAMALLPLTAAAAWTTAAPFGGPKPDREWRINGQTDATTPTREGVRIATREKVTIYRTLDVGHPVDMVEIEAVVDRPVEATLLWHRHDAPEDRIVQLPIELQPNGSLPTVLTLPLLNYADWDRHADTLGLHLPPGSSLLLRDIRFIGLPWYERWGNAVQSLFVFDNFTRHSINFLWGPLVAFDPQTRATLYEASPPTAWSVNRILLPALAITTGALGLCAWLLPPMRRRLLLCALGIVAGAWLLFDLRMGSEILSYALTDARTYVSQDQGNRSLRGMADFHDILDRFLRLTAGKERIGFVSDPSLLLESSATYMAYPRWVAFPGEPQDGVDTWLVYLHTGAEIDDKGRLMVNGTALSGTGTARLLEQSNGHTGIVTTAP